MRQVDVAVWNDASNVRIFRSEDVVLRRYEGKLRTSSLKRRPSTRTVLKALVTSREIRFLASSSQNSWTLSMRRVYCNVLLCLRLNPLRLLHNSLRPLLHKEIWKILSNCLPSCLADLWVDKTRAAPDPFRFSGWKTRACFQAGESTGFEISH